MGEPGCARSPNAPLGALHTHTERPEKWFRGVRAAFAVPFRTDAPHRGREAGASSECRALL